MRVVVAHCGNQTADIQAALSADGHDVAPVQVDPDFPWVLAQESPEAVFNAAVGFPGRYGAAFVPLVADAMGLPCTGPDVLTAALCQDRTSLPVHLSRWGVNSPKTVRVTTEQDLNDIQKVLGSAGGRYPVVVQPASSAGGTWIDESSYCAAGSDVELACAQLLISGQPVVVRDYIPGREFSALVLGEGRDLEMLTPVEVSLTEVGAYLYSSDLRGMSDIIMPVTDLHPKLLAILQETVRIVVGSLGILDFGRVDLRLGRDNIFHVLDVDQMPEFDLRVKTALTKHNLNVDQIIQFVLNSAVHRYASEHSVESSGE